MSAGGNRTLVTLCVAAAAFLAGYLVGRSGAPEPRESALASRAEPSSESIPARDVERASSRPRHRADTESAAPSPATESAAAPVDAPAERPAATVRVVVRDRAGAPLAGATVEATAHLGPQGDWMAIVGARPTGADGVTALDLSESILSELSRLSVSVSREGYVGREVLVSRDSARGGGIVDVDLDRLVEVIGRCVDRGGQALAGIRVVGPGSSAQTATDEAGGFRLSRVAQTGAHVRFLPEKRPIAAARVEVPAALGGVVDLGDVLLEVGETLRGRFLDAAGNAIPGAKAMLVSRELEGVVVCGEARTDAEGRFAFEHVGRGTFDLGLVRPGVALDDGDNTDVAYEVRASEEVVFRAARDHYVGVQFVDEDKAMVKFRGGRVTWYALDDTSDRLDWWGLDGGWDHFHIAARPGATYEVRIELDGWEPATIRATATDARDTHVDAVLRRRMR